MSRAAVFIDGGYIDKVLESFAEVKKDYSLIPKIDYQALAKQFGVEVDCEVFRTYYYDCSPYQGNPPTPEERARFVGHERFMTVLRRMPRFEVRLGRLDRIPTGPNSYKYQQKRVNSLLTLDLAKLSWQKTIQTAVIISGDSDFIPAVNEAKNMGVLTRVYYSKKGSCRIHDQLHQTCDEKIEITSDLIKAVGRGFYKKKHHSFVESKNSTYEMPQ